MRFSPFHCQSALRSEIQFRRRPQIIKVIRLKFPACISVSPFAGLAGDIDGDGDLDSIDQQLFLAVLLGADNSIFHMQRADLNAYGQANGSDLAVFVTSLMTP